MEHRGQLALRRADEPDGLRRWHEPRRVVVAQPSSSAAAPSCSVMAIVPGMARAAAEAAGSGGTGVCASIRSFHPCQRTSCPDGRTTPFASKLRDAASRSAAFSASASRGAMPQARGDEFQVADHVARLVGSRSGGGGGGCAIGHGNQLRTEGRVLAHHVCQSLSACGRPTCSADEEVRRVLGGERSEVAVVVLCEDELVEQIRNELAAVL